MPYKTIYLTIILNVLFSFSYNFAFCQKQVVGIKGISKILKEGISKDDFLNVCCIEWTPVDSLKNAWKPINVSLENQISYDSFQNTIKDLNRSHIVKASTASLLSKDGRLVYCIEIGKGENTIVFTAGVHAREVANPQFLLKFASILVNGYENGEAKYVKLLEDSKVIMLPCVNPDGYEAAIMGNMAIKNKELFLARQKNENVFMAKSNANGVDLNRNFPSYSASVVWKDEKQKPKLNDTIPSINYFAGHYLGSENETQIAMNFLMRYIPIARRYIDFHSAGHMIYAGKPNLSDSFNIACKQTAQLIKLKTNYALFGVEKEDVGLGADGTITDFAAEIAAGFVFNKSIGRIAPAASDSLITKTEQYPYKCSVNTVETIITHRRDGYGLLRASTPKTHMVEWEKYHLLQVFTDLMSF